MKFLVLALSLGTLVFARPDVSHLTSSGYHYKPPATSYGVPIDTGYSGSGQFSQKVPTDSYGVPLTQDKLNPHIPTNTYAPGNIQFQLPFSQNKVDFLGSNSGNNYESYNPHLIQDQKHVYFYTAPEDNEPTRVRVHVAPRPRKTNVIVVKAPSTGPIIPEVIAEPNLSEEKTKVYVLLKKSQQPTSIKIPAPVSIKSQPEVYVVKYDNEKEAQKVIASGGRGGHELGDKVNNLGDEASFISSLSTDIRKQISQNDKYSGFDGNVNVFARIGGGKKASGGSVASSFGSSDELENEGITRIISGPISNFNSFGVSDNAVNRGFGINVAQGGVSDLSHIQAALNGQGSGIQVHSIQQGSPGSLFDSFGKSAFEINRGGSIVGSTNGAFGSSSSATGEKLVDFTIEKGISL